MRGVIHGRGPVRLVQRNEDDLVQLHFLLQDRTWQEWTPMGLRVH